MEDYSINEEQLKLFWELIKPENENEYLEVKNSDGGQQRNQLFTSQQYYSRMALLQQQNPDIIVKNGCQFFIQTYEQMMRVLSFDNYFLPRNYKVCYGLNTRWKKSREPAINLDGKLTRVKKLRFIFFDIEKVKHDNLTAQDDRELDRFVQEFTSDMYLYKQLDSPTVIHSGGGRHVLYRITPIHFTHARYEALKLLMKNIHTSFSTEQFKLDTVKDGTRVLGLPETMNVKRDVKVRIVAYNDFVNDVVLHTQKKVKPKNIVFGSIAKDRATYLFENSLEWRIFRDTSIPTGEVHTIILFATKLLLKALNIEAWDYYQDEVNSLRGSKHSLNPATGTDNKTYTPYIIINWLLRHKEWAEKAGIKVEGYADYMKSEMRLEEQ